MPMLKSSKGPKTAKAIASDAVTTSDTARPIDAGIAEHVSEAPRPKRAKKVKPKEAATDNTEHPTQLQVAAEATEAYRIAVAPNDPKEFQHSFGRRICPKGHPAKAKWEAIVMTFFAYVYPREQQHATKTKLEDMVVDQIKLQFV
jgi:hypothetical protein